MNETLLYMGDDALDRAAAYLGGVMTRAGLAFDYVRSDESLEAAALVEQRSLYVISDFPVKNFRPGALERVVEHVCAGSGLVMIGGWESFHGALGEYHETPLADVLPVAMFDSDDRVNCPQPCLMEKVSEHAILEGLPLDRPAGIGGYNRVVAKPEATTLLVARRFEVSRRERKPRVDSALEGQSPFLFQPIAEADPLLVVGQFGEGRSAAFTTDVAPHWVGGLVDWGAERVAGQAPSGVPVEVGNLYARFLEQLVRWTRG